MAYGTPRATVTSKGIRCMKCTTELVENGTLPLEPGNTLWAPQELLEAYGIHALVARGYVKPQSIYSEGQSGDQRFLETHHCQNCQKLLADDCTDY